MKASASESSEVRETSETESLAHLRAALTREKRLAADLERQLAKARKTLLVELTRSEKAQPAIAELRQTLRSIRISRMYRLAMWYYQLYGLPLLGPVLRSVRRMIGNILRSDRI